MITFISLPHELDDACVADEVARDLDLLGLVVSDSASTRETAIITSRAVSGMSNDHILLFGAVTHANDATAVGGGRLDLPGDEVTGTRCRFIVDRACLGATAWAFSQSACVNALALNRA